jgi:hypothetical protein
MKNNVLKTLSYILIGTGVGIPLLIYGGYYLLAHFHPSEWVKVIAEIKILNETPVKYIVTFPKSSIYGRKHIGLDTSNLDGSELTTEIEIAVINKSKGTIGVSNKMFFSGDLHSDEKAIFFKGAIADMPKQFKERLPSISNRKSDNKIEIWLSSKKEVTFSSPLRLFVFTYANFL